MLVMLETLEHAVILNQYLPDVPVVHYGGSSTSFDTVADNLIKAGFFCFLNHNLIVLSLTLQRYKKISNLPKKFLLFSRTIGIINIKKNQKQFITANISF